jgi:RNA polymerase sigma-70 factor, ECF subfamily
VYGDVAQEGELVARAQAGDREAFAALIVAYQQPVGGYLWRLTGDRELAEDLTQETFLRAYRAIAATRPGLQLRSWLYRIATNLAYDHFRRQRRFGFVPLLPMHGVPQWEQTTGVDEADAVWRALARLRPGDRAALLLCALEGYSYREAAQVLGISPEAVRKQFGRAKQRFRRAYAEQTANPRATGCAGASFWLLHGVR